MRQMHCTRLAAGGLACCWRMLALCALCLLCAPTPCAHAASPAWRPDAPLGAHAMLYLDAPYSFKRTMFQAIRRARRTLHPRRSRAHRRLHRGRHRGLAQGRRGHGACARLSRCAPSASCWPRPWFIAACAAEPTPTRPALRPRRVEADGLEHRCAHARRHPHLRDPQRARRPVGVHGLDSRLRQAAACRPRRNKGRQPAGPGRDRRDDGPRLPALARAVFAQAGPHPERLFDIVNVHIRASLRQLPGTLRAWRRFFAAHRASGKPLWITEFGYPSDPPTSTTRVPWPALRPGLLSVPRDPSSYRRSEGLCHPAGQPGRPVRVRGRDLGSVSDPPG